SSLIDTGDGDYSFYVNDLDAMLEGPAVAFTLDTVAPAAPTLNEPTTPIASTETPSFTGEGEFSSTVTVSDGTSDVCTAIVAQDALWSCAPAAPLASGSYSLTAQQTDLAGNVSPLSAAVALLV